MGKECLELQRGQAGLKKKDVGFVGNCRKQSPYKRMGNRSVRKKYVHIVRCKIWVNKKVSGKYSILRRKYYK